MINEIIDGLVDEKRLTEVEADYIKAQYAYDFAAESTSMDYSVVLDAAMATRDLREANLSVERLSFLDGILAVLRYM